MYLSIVIPAYNEEKRLPKTLDKVVGYLKSQNYESEVIVVDDGSTDKTAEIVNTFAEKFSHIKCVVNEINKGKAHSVHRGVLLAKGDLILFMDADGSTSIQELDKLIREINNGYDVAIGSRRVFGANVMEDQVWSRLLLGWIFRQIVSLLLPINIIDTQNGFKLFKKEVAKQVFSKQKSFGWAFDVEILYLVSKFGYKTKEVPIVWVNDHESKVKLLGKIKMLFEIIKIRFADYR